MKFKQKIFLAAAASSFCLAAHAIDPQDVGLMIHNHTNEPSTVKINHQICSTKLGATGVTQPGHDNPIDKKTVKSACIFSRPPTDCFAEIYMTASCGDNNAKPVAEVHFDPATGIKTITATSTPQNYVVTGSGFEVTFTGGPSKSKMLWFHKIFG